MAVVLSEGERRRVAWVVCTHLQTLPAWLNALACRQLEHALPPIIPLLDDKKITNQPLYPFFYSCGSGDPYEALLGSGEGDEGEHGGRVEMLANVMGGDGLGPSWTEWSLRGLGFLGEGGDPAQRGGENRTEEGEEEDRGANGQDEEGGEMDEEEMDETY